MEAFNKKYGHENHEGLLEDVDDDDDAPENVLRDKLSAGGSKMAIELASAYLIEAFALEIENSPCLGWFALESNGDNRNGPPDPDAVAKILCRQPPCFSRCKSVKEDHGRELAGDATKDEKKLCSVAGL